MSTEHDPYSSVTVDTAVGLDGRAVAYQSAKNLDYRHF